MHEVYVHHLNPFALHLWGNFGIRWYGLAYLAGFVASYLIIRRRIVTGRSPLHLEQVGDFVFTVALGTIIGGRLGYCLFYSPELLVRFTSSPPFWGVLALHQGGMASHGGILGILAACVIFARRHKLPVLHLMDLTAVTGPVGIFFGRIASFINGELVGRPAPPGLPWAVKFPQDILLWPSEEPQRLADLKDAAAQVGIAPQQWLEFVARYPNSRSAYASLDAALGSIVQAIQEGHEQIRQLVGPYLTARHPSQLYEALLEGLLLFVVLTLFWRKPRVPGIVSSLFVMCYAAVRIVGEQFRMPDPQIGFQLLGLTRGQWLSVVMFFVGAAFFAWLQRARRGMEKY